jgi:hypothetical protein
MKAIVIDTSILCVYLQIPFMETCGAEPDVWNYELVSMKLDIELEADATLVLPLATIVETGNHIAHLETNRRPYAEAFVDILRATVNNENPWTAFSEQTHLWNDENMLKLADNFPDLVEQGLGIGDATIKDVADFYAEARYEVEIFTGDGGLKAYQPAPPNILTPRRRK